MIERLSVEVVVADFKYTTVLEKFLRKSLFKGNAVRREFTVAVKLNHHLNFWVFRLSLDYRRLPLRANLIHYRVMKETLCNELDEVVRVG